MDTWCLDKALNKLILHLSDRTLDQSRFDKVTETMAKITPKTKDAFVFARMKEKQDKEKKTSESPLSFGSALGGKPVKVFPSTPARKKLLYDSKAAISKGTFENIASATDMSNQKVKLVASEFRKSEGRKGIESGFAADLSKIPQEIIKKYFKTVYVPFQVMNNKNLEMQRRKFVFCHDLTGYIKHIKKERGISEDVEIEQKIGIDGGGNFFKTCINIIEKKKPEKSPPKKKQNKSKKYKDGGVKKLLIIAIVQDIAETYFNAKTILKLLEIEKIDFVIATDYKLCNILLGLSSHASKFRCP